MSEQDLSPAEYLVEDPDTADDHYLERVVYRHYGWPWNIAETERLRIREFHLKDLGQIPAETDSTGDDRIFSEKDTLEAYIRFQYRFFDSGIWAVIRKNDECLIGQAGVTDCGGRLELGYRIFRPYRNCGYATEACRAILAYVDKEFNQPVYAKTETGNAASVNVLKKLGFTQPETGNLPGQDWYQYVWNY